MMEDFKTPEELNHFMSGIERENFEAYIKHLEKQRVYISTKVQTPDAQVKALLESIISSLKNELATNPAPYEFADLNKSVLERRDYYLSEFEAMLKKL